jgi:uncharacterized protein with HEPN domain
MSERDHRITLRQISEYIEHAQVLCAGKSAAEIEEDWRVALAFERAMEVIGEAVKRLPEDLKTRYPQVPWRLVAGMRDKLSHGYDSVDYQLLWDAVQNDLPSLQVTVERMLSEMKNSSPT